jgi:uncharacterized protein
MSQSGISSYSEVADLENLKALLIIVNKSVKRRSLYDATRFAWKIDKSKASKAELIFAVANGIIVGVFVADKWLDATAANFPGRGHEPTRSGFIGHEAPPEVAKLYVNKRVPDSYRKPGASNPIKYTW